MFEYIEGHIADITPTDVVIDVNGVGYFIHISLNSYTSLQSKKQARIFIHQIVREDANLLYGFSTPEERQIFRLLLSVSGVGASTARMILSSLTPTELQSAISTENVNIIKSIKGIGLKSAQRIIIDLRDKIKIDTEIDEIIGTTHNTNRDEALSALEILGFAKKPAEKVINKLVASHPEFSVEELIKHALTQL